MLVSFRQWVEEKYDLGQQPGRAAQAIRGRWVGRRIVTSGWGHAESLRRTPKRAAVGC